MRSYSSVRGDVHASKCELTLGGICCCRWGCRGATERYDGEREGLLTRQELFFRTQIQRSIVALDTLSCFHGGLRQYREISEKMLVFRTGVSIGLREIGKDAHDAAGLRGQLEVFNVEHERTIRLLHIGRKSDLYCDRRTLHYHTPYIA